MKRGWLLGGVIVLGLGFALLRPPGAKPASAEPRGSGISFQIGGGSQGKTVEVAELERGRIASLIEATGTIRAGSEVGVSAPFEGKVLEIVVDEGDRVAAGDVMFRLDPTTYQQALLEAEIELLRQENALSEARSNLGNAQRNFEEANEEPAELTEAKLRARSSALSRDRSQAELEQGRNRLSRSQRMLDEGIGREMDVDEAQDSVRLAEINLRIAQQELGLAEETLKFRVDTWEDTKSTVAKDLAVSETRLRRAEADLKAARLSLEKAQRDLADCQVRTPMGGIVTGRGINSGELVARVVSGDSSHYIVSDLDRLFAYLDVDEADVVEVQPGQPAQVKVPALGRTAVLTAKVYDVGYRAQATDDVKTFRVRVLLDEGQPEARGLRPGMTATAEIETRQNDEALRVPLQAVVQKEVKRLPDQLEARAEELGLAEDDYVDAVFVVEDGAVRLALIELGIQNATEGEVLSGLAAGETIVVGPFRRLEQLKDGDKVKLEEADDEETKASESDSVAGVDSGSRAS